MTTAIQTAHASLLERVLERPLRHGATMHLATRLRDLHRVVHGFAIELAREPNEERRSLVEACAAEVLHNDRPARELASRFRMLIAAIDADAAKSGAALASRDEE